MGIPFQVNYPDGTTHDFVQFMTQLAISGCDAAYNIVAECENDGAQPVDIRWLESPTVLTAMMFREHMKIVLRSDDKTFEFVLSRPISGDKIVELPIVRLVREINIVYSDTAFQTESQPMPTARNTTLDALPLFDVPKATNGEPLTIPPLSSPGKDLLNDLLKDAPTEVREKLSEQRQYMNFLHLVESIRTNPEYVIDTPFAWPVQTLIDYLHRRTPGDVCADEALKLAAAANRALLMERDLRVVDGSGGPVRKTLMSSGNSFTYILRDTSAGDAPHQIIPNIKLSIGKSGPAEFSITSCTDVGGRNAQFKPTPENLQKISTVVTKFINKMLDPNGILDIVNILLTQDTNQHALGPVLLAALETRVTAGSSGWLSEETFSFPSPMSGSLSRVVEVIMQRLQDQSYSPGLASRKSAKTLVSYAARTAMAQDFGAEMTEVLVTDVLTTVYPVVSALLFRILCNMSNALARRYDTLSPITPSLSHLGPHLVVSHKIKKINVQLAHSLMDAPDIISAKLSLGKKRAGDLIALLKRASTGEAVGVPDNIKSLFILPDPQTYINIHLGATISSVQSRMCLERCLKMVLAQLSSNGFYVVAHRKPLELDELTVSGNLVTGSIYKLNVVPEYRWSRRGSSCRSLAPRGIPPVDRGDLGCLLAAINSTLRRRAKLAKTQLDLTAQVRDNRLLFSRDARIATNGLPLRNFRVIRTGQYDIDSYSPVRVDGAGQTSDFTGQVRWSQDFNSHPIQLEMCPQSVPAVKKMAESSQYKILLCASSGNYYDRPNSGIEPESVHSSTGDGVEPVEQRYQRMLQAAAWYEMPKIEEARETLRYTGENTEFKYGIIGQTPDASRVLYPAFSFYLPDAFHFNYMWTVFLGEMLPASAYVPAPAKVAEAQQKVEQNYVPDEYSKAYRKAKKERLDAERKRALAELRRLREEYATFYRNKIPHLRRRNTEVSKMLRSGTETLGEEHALQQAMSRGHIEGFRVIDGTLLLKMPEINIYEQGLIYNIGKFVVSIAGFDGANHYDIRFYNVSRNVHNVSDHRVYDHPHVRSGKACLGNVEGMLSNAIQNDDLLTVVELCKGYLNSVNSRDTFGQYIFTQWRFALPTIHNLIKFGIAGQITKDTVIALYKASGNNELTAQKAKDIPYFKIKAEFDAIYDLCADPSIRTADSVTSLKSLPAQVYELVTAAAHSCDSRYNCEAATTDRSEAEIRRSLADFQALVASEEAWNAAVGRKTEKPEVAASVIATAVA